MDVISLTRDVVELEESFAKSSTVIKNDRKYGLIHLPKFYVDFDDYSERNAATDAVAADAVAQLCGEDGEFPGEEKMVKEAVRSLMKKLMRERVLAEGGAPARGRPLPPIARGATGPTAPEGRTPCDMLRGS